MERYTWNRKASNVDYCCDDTARQHQAILDSVKMTL